MHAGASSATDSLARLRNASGLPFDTTVYDVAVPTPGAVNMPEPGGTLGLLAGTLALGVLRRREGSAAAR